MATKIEPTEEGKERHPPDGYYTANGERIPCTCTPKCTYSCRGLCGCEACHQAYGDFGYG